MLAIKRDVDDHDDRDEPAMVDDLDDRGPGRAVLRHPGAGAADRRTTSGTGTFDDEPTRAAGRGPVAGVAGGPPAPAVTPMIPAAEDADHAQAASAGPSCTPRRPRTGPARVGCRTTVTAGHLTCAFPSHPAHLAAVRRAVEAFCRDTPLDEPARDELGLVVNEAMANVMRHAYAGATDRPVEVTADRVAGGVRLAIRDWGTAGIPKPTDNPAAADPLLPGGLGLICLQRLTDGATFEPQPDGGMKLVHRPAPRRAGRARPPPP